MLKAVAPAIGLIILVASPLEAAEPSQKWSPWLDGGGFYNNKDESRGESTLWVPLMQSPSSLFFGEVKGKIFEAEQREGNFALGFRQMQTGGWNIGIWGGYDVRSTSLGNTFSQVSGGIEALSRNWDFRANGYVPLDDNELVGSTTVSSGTGTPTILLNGPSILLQTGINSTTSTTRELALGGFDAEIGMRFPVEALKLDAEKLDLRLYGGGFYFDGPDADKAVAGPKVRGELRFNDVIAALPGSRLTLETEYTNDDVRGDRVEAGARFRIPLTGESRSFASLNAQEQRMSEALRRDTDIVAAAKTTTTTVNTLTTEGVVDGATNVDLDKVAYVDGATAGGITAVANAQGAKTLIIAQGGNGNITSDTVLKDGQTLMGGGSTITLQGKNTGTLVQFTAPGSQPTLVGQTNYALNIGSNSHVAGLGIQAGPSGGIQVGLFGFNIVTHNVVIDNNTIDANGHDGIYTTGGYPGNETTNLVISNNMITGALNGLNVATTSNTAITGNTITGATNSAIYTGNTVSDLTISGNTLAGGWPRCGPHYLDIARHGLRYP